VEAGCFVAVLRVRGSVESGRDGLCSIIFTLKQSEADFASDCNGKFTNNECVVTKPEAGLYPLELLLQSTK